MVMCQHSQDYETCRFGCTLRKKEELRLENDQLKERIKELEADQCPSWMGKDKGCNETTEVEELEKRIKDLENFLKEKMAVAKVSADNENYSVNITIKEIEQVLKGGD